MYHLIRTILRNWSTPLKAKRRRSRSRIVESLEPRELMTLTGSAMFNGSISVALQAGSESLHQDIPVSLAYDSGPRSFGHLTVDDVSSVNGEDKRHSASVSIDFTGSSFIVNSTAFGDGTSINVILNLGITFSGETSSGDPLATTKMQEAYSNILVPGFDSHCQASIDNVDGKVLRPDGTSERKWDSLTVITESGRRFNLQAEVGLSGSGTATTTAEFWTSINDYQEPYIQWRIQI